MSNFDADPYDPPLARRELGNQYALHALRERRAYMTGELATLERRRRWLRDSIRHLDATMAFMTPGHDPTLVKAKFPRRKSKLFGKGKLNAMILNALRRGDRPMSIAEVTASVAEQMQLGTEAVTGLRDRVRSNLLYLTSVRGLAVKTGDRVAARWSIAQFTNREALPQSPLSP